MWLCGIVRRRRCVGRLLGIRPIRKDRWARELIVLGRLGVFFRFASSEQRNPATDLKEGYLVSDVYPNER